MGSLCLPMCAEARSGSCRVNFQPVNGTFSHQKPREGRLTSSSKLQRKHFCLAHFLCCCTISSCFPLHEYESGRRIARRKLGEESSIFSFRQVATCSPDWTTCFPD